MIATYSFEALLVKKLDAWNLPLDVFAVLIAMHGVTGAGKSRLHSAINGYALPNSVSELMQPILDDISELADAVQPLALDMTKPAQIYDWLKLRRENRLRISVEITQ